MRRYAVILAGGRGERFWPLSRPERPKPFLRLFGNQTLLEATFARLRSIFTPERIFVVVPPPLVALVRTELPELPPENVLVEPEPRDTAYAVLFALQHLGEGIVAFFPADHFVGNEEAFREDVNLALEVAEEREGLVALGVLPSYPATGYGYLEQGEEVRQRVFRVWRFVEKPPREKAMQLYRSGRHYWNAGIFFGGKEVWIEEFARHAPDILKGEVPKASVDHALMEKSQRVYMIPASFPWDDLGDWLALERHLKGEGQNLALARHVGMDTKGVIVYASGDELVVTLGLENLLIVREGRVTLIAHKERIQDLKALLRELEKLGEPTVDG